MVTHPLPPCLVIFSHPHIPTQTPHTKNIFSWCLYPLPPCIYTLKGMSRRDVIFVSLSLDHSHFSCYLSHPLSAPPRPRQMHQLHIHTCYITYPIDLKSPLFTFISHTTFLLNKVWPKKYFGISTYIQHYKVIWRSMNACIAWCPQ